MKYFRRILSSIIAIFLCMSAFTGTATAATRYDRLDATFLANLQLILIAVYLKNTAKNPTSVNTP